MTTNVSFGGSPHTLVDKIGEQKVKDLEMVFEQPFLGTEGITCTASLYAKDAPSAHPMINLLKMVGDVSDTKVFKLPVIGAIFGEQGGWGDVTVGQLTKGCSALCTVSQWDWASGLGDFAKKASETLSGLGANMSSLLGSMAGTHAGESSLGTNNKSTTLSLALLGMGIFALGSHIGSISTGDESRTSSGDVDEPIDAARSLTLGDDGQLPFPEEGEVIEPETQQTLHSPEWRRHRVVRRAQSAPTSSDDSKGRRGRGRSRSARA